jgi:hypothetical protein
VGFFVFGGMQFMITKFRPVGEPKNLRPVARTANGIARNFQNLAIPTMVGAALLALIGGIG